MNMLNSESGHGKRGQKRCQVLSYYMQPTVQNAAFFNFVYGSQKKSSISCVCRIEWLSRWKSRKHVCTHTATSVYAWWPEQWLYRRTAANDLVGFDTRRNSAIQQILVLPHPCESATYSTSIAFPDPSAVAWGPLKMRYLRRTRHWLDAPESYINLHSFRWGRFFWGEASEESDDVLAAHTRCARLDRSSTLVRKVRFAKYIMGRW